MNKEVLLANVGRARINKLDIKSIHPKQFIFDDIPVTVHRVEYSYTTTRGNKKNGEKYLVVNSFNPQIDIKSIFEKWARSYNTENPNRSLLNVKFLSSEAMTLLTI